MLHRRHGASQNVDVTLDAGTLRGKFKHGFHLKWCQGSMLQLMKMITIFSHFRPFSAKNWRFS
jgi:hypothetical protein